MPERSTPRKKGAKRERPKERLARCHHQVEQNPGSAKAHYNMGLAYSSVGKLMAAEKEYMTAVELDDRLAEAWTNLGGVRLLMWDFEGCLAATKRAVELRADLPLAHYNMGQAYLYLNDPDNLVRCNRRVLELDRNHAAAHYHMAVGLLAQNDIGGAQRHLGRATELGHRPTPELIRAMERAARKNTAQQGNLIEISGAQKAPENKKEE